MPVDVETETLITETLITETLIDFAATAREFPGRAVCIQTLHRYRLNGVRGVKLESCLIGGRRFTSREAVARFIAAQNASESPPAISQQQRAKQSAAARRELERFNV